MRGKPPKCRRCRRNLPSSKPRVTIEGGWYCPDCAITKERGELPKVAKPRRPRKPQDETLFDA